MTTLLMAMATLVLADILILVLIAAAEELFRFLKRNLVPAKMLLANLAITFLVAFKFTR